MAKDPSRTRMKKRKGHASVLHAADVRRVVNERVAANGPERVSLRGRALADADAVEAVCDAVLALGGVGQNSDDDAASPTVTLNLASGNVCGAGAARLAAFLLDPRCRVRELNLVDNPRLGVHLADIPDCPPAHAVEHTDEDKVVDGGGCEALARALQSPKCSLTQLNLGGCGVTCKGASALAKALSIDELIDDHDRVAMAYDEGYEGPGEKKIKGRDATNTPSPRLTLIHLRSNDVGYAGVVDLAKAALRHGGIREVTLGNNAQVTRDALNELEEVLRKNRRSALANELRDACLPLSVPGEPEELNVVQTRSCSLRRRRLRDEDAATIAAALRPGSVADTLTQLDLSDNELTAFGIETLTHAIRGVAGNASLAFVSVAGNPGAHFDGGDAVRLETTRDANRLTVPSDANARFVEGSRSLSLTKTAPFSSAARALHGVVAVNFLTRAGRGEALKSVADRGLGDEGACEIASVITQTATYARDARSWAFLLEAIGTQHNDIGARGAEALANALALLPNLKEWASYANPLGVAGARALARAVAAPGRFRSLEILDVGGCGVLDAGCVAIANAIVGHERLRELHLDHNEIGETGSLALLGSMTRTAESSSSAVVVGVRRVWLHGNPLVPDAVVARVHALAARTSALADARTGGGRLQFEPAPSLEPYEATVSFDARCRADAERLALRVYRTRSKHPTDANRRVDSSALFADRVAAYVTTTYRRRCPEHFAATRGAAVIAAVVAHETSRGFDSETPGGEDFLFVVALGVGTKFMPGPVAAAAAAGGDDAWEKVVHDSHAEVLARRAFCRFLNREMRELVSAERAHAQNRVNPGWPTAAPDKKSADFAEPEKFRVLECTRDGRGFQVRANVTLHLYVSTAPCGAASAAETSVRSYERTDGKKEKKAEETRTLNANANADAVANTHSGPVLAPNFDPRAGSGFDPGAFLASTLPPAPRWASSLDSVFARDETAQVRTETRAKEQSEPLEKKKEVLTTRPRDVVEYDLDDVAYADAFRGLSVHRRHTKGVYGARSMSRRAMRKGTMPPGLEHAAPAPGCVTLPSLRDAVGVPGATLACSDKIAKWQVLGAQGACLSVLVPTPVTFASIVVGRKFDGDALRLGTCCRSAGFPHETFRLPEPKHCAALRTAVKIESDALDEETPEKKNDALRHRASFIADARRADAGDSDESLTWCRHESSVTRHDGRTGTVVGGGGPAPVVSRAWAFRDVSETLRAVRGKRDIVDVDENATMFRAANSRALKAAAKPYAAARHALVKGNVPPTSALAGWRGNA